MTINMYDDVLSFDGDDYDRIIPQQDEVEELDFEAEYLDSLGPGGEDAPMPHCDNYYLGF